MTGLELAFVPLGAVALGAAVLVVTTKALVHAALWLVLSFAALAGCFLLLTAELVAWVQVLIYAGAVIVLLLFGIMLTKAPIGETSDVDSGNRPAALVVALGTAATLGTVVVSGFGTAYVDLGGAPAGGAQTVGAAVFRYWVLPFEALSVVLLAALIGAIVLSRGDIGPRPDSRTGPADGGAG
ncbi:NADH-quinone oxidoreductase subunit J [Actinophytocola sp.]|uniref:NADH-quinone oxidoreductase subunit J family protein n=1 Tax=Actinophytocola sp. TaxID=1872138 RepID=UPI002EDADB49